jgi:alkylation response protein AidB-like acyl-CoA dehydrogenase
MDLRYPPESEAFRKKVQAFLTANLPADWDGIGALPSAEGESFAVDWRQTMHANGMLGVAWPVAYGGQGLTKLEQVILAEEFARRGVPTGLPVDTFGIKMVGNTLLKWGTEEQKRHYLPRILSGQDVWCQGYSEPDAGSDLGSIKTKAERDGDEWVINGQKIWTSAAHAASMIFMLARTDPEAPKHKGITFLLVPMAQRGIEVRPIKMMNTTSDFNEVFFTNARTPVGNVVGEVNAGWTVAMTLLGHERGEEASINPVNFRFEWNRLAQMVSDRGLGGNKVIRDRLAQCYVKVETMRFLGYRILTGVLRDGKLGPEASISKLHWSQYHMEVTDLALEVMGADAMVCEGRIPPRAYRADDPGSPNSSNSWLGVRYAAVAGGIYAGANQIQRNILAESVLGLPK